MAPPLPGAGGQSAAGAESARPPNTAAKLTATRPMMPEWDVSRVGCVVPLRFTPPSTRLSSLTLDPREKRVDEPVCVCHTPLCFAPSGLVCAPKNAPSFVLSGLRHSNFNVPVQKGWRVDRGQDGEYACLWPGLVGGQEALLVAYRAAIE